jgi:hypothetical protein
VPKGWLGRGLALRSPNRSGNGLVLSGVSDSGALDSSLLVGFRAVEIFFHLAPGSQSENHHVFHALATIRCAC